MTEKAFIYFFTDGLVIKIGRSTQWRRRQSEVSRKVDMWVLPRLVLVSDPGHEGFLHYLFRKSRISANYDGTLRRYGKEWFHPTPDIEAYITKYRADDVTYYCRDINGWDEDRFQHWKAEQLEVQQRHRRRKEIEAYKERYPEDTNRSISGILYTIDARAKHLATLSAMRAAA